MESTPAAPQLSAEDIEGKDLVAHILEATSQGQLLYERMIGKGQIEEHRDKEEDGIWFKGYFHDDKGTPYTRVMHSSEMNQAFAYCNENKAGSSIVCLKDKDLNSEDLARILKEAIMKRVKEVRTEAERKYNKIETAVESGIITWVK